MPLIKTSGACGGAVKRLGEYAGKARDYVGSHKAPIALVGAAGLTSAGLGYRKRAKTRAREDALVQGILNRNMQKEAALFPFMKALGSGVKNLVSGVGGGLKTGVKNMATGFGNAGFKGVENGINTAGKWTMNQGRNMMNSAQQFGRNMMNSRAGQWAMNQGQRAWNTGQNMFGQVRGWFGPGGNQ